MNAKGKSHIADVLASVEAAIPALPAAELPALIGAVERLSASAWLRLRAGDASGGENGQLLTIQETAARLKLSRYRTYELCRQGALKSVHMGRSVRVRAADLAAYVAQQGSLLYTDRIV